MSEVSRMCVIAADTGLRVRWSTVFSGGTQRARYWSPDILATASCDFLNEAAIKHNLEQYKSQKLAHWENTGEELMREILHWES